MQVTEPTTRRGLVRRPSGRLIAGVAGGLADATGTHPGWWRLGFVLLAAVGGLGVAIYLILWVVIPRADLPRSAGQRLADRLPGAPGWLGVALLGFGLLVLIANVWPTGLLGRPSVPFAHEIRDASPAFALAITLIGLGILLFRRDEHADEPGTDATLPTTLELGTGEAEPRVRRVRRRRERSVLGWLSLGLALAAAGIVWWLLNIDVIEPSFSQAMALPLAILGLGLLVGSIVGRARWTILLGLPLVPLVLIASLIPTPITGHYTERTLTPRRATQLRDTYQQSGGTLVIDLTQLKEGEHPGPIEAMLGIGVIRILVTKNTPVDITGSVGIGILSLLGGPNVSGLGVTDSYRTGVFPIQLTLEVGIGEVTVFRIRVPHRQGDNA